MQIQLEDKNIEELKLWYTGLRRIEWGPRYEGCGMQYRDP